ncbi:MAG: hypothetical protein ACM32E_28185 [Gemmatimonadota bacterium]
MVTQVPHEGLTSVEQSLVEHVGRGEWLDLTADDEVVDEAAMRSWGDDRAISATVIRDILRGKLAADRDPHGLRLRGARITGQLDLENLSTEVNLELEDCLLEEGLVARDAHLAFVRLTGCQLEHPAEPPLNAARLTCSGLGLTKATIIGHADLGAVRLPGAHIDGSLECDGATLLNDFGAALYAEGVQVGQGMFLVGGFTATGAGDPGAVNLRGASIGSLECDEAVLRNETGAALYADGLQVGQGMSLGGGFTATGAGADGAVQLRGSRIGGQLTCDGAVLRNDSGPALHADALQVGQDMFLRDGFAATGSGKAGAVRLLGANIGGQVACIEASLCNNSGPALDAEGLQVGQDMILRGGFTATGGGAGVAVDLTGTRVGGTLVFAPGRLRHATDPHHKLAVDGLTYAGVPKSISAGEWLGLLRNGTPGYRAQPYQQLAAGYRALGDERQTREILIAQRDDQLTRTRPRPRWPERWWGWITKVTLGYGYKPWRALWFLAGIVAISCLLAVALGSHGALAQTANTAAPGGPCTVVQRVSVGLDLNLPVGTSLARADCDLTRDPTSAAATWLIAGGWVLRLLAWAFAALFIAGFTSAVRKT